MNSVETKNQVGYTQDEKDLAKKYKVEPKTVRLIAEIVSEHTKDTAGVQQLIDLMKGRKEQEAQPEQAETQAEPEQEQPTEEKGPGATIENMVEEWLRKQPYRTKLAISIFTGYMQGDHGANEITDRINNESDREVLEMIQNPDSALSKEDTIMTGIAAELFVWSKNL